METRLTSGKLTREERREILNNITKIKVKIFILKSQIVDPTALGLRKTRRITHSHKKKARTHRKRSFGKTKKHNKKSHNKKTRKH